jgi:hypothetical protein
MSSTMSPPQQPTDPARADLPLDLNARYKRFRNESRSFLGGVARPYLLDALILILVVLVAYSICRDWRIAAKVNFVVARPSGLDPFHPITASDLALDCKSKNPVPGDAAAKVVGRYSLVFLKTCDPLDPAKLANPVSPRDLLGRVLIRLKVQPTSLFVGMSPPFKTGLMFAPHEQGTTALLLDNVLILDLQKDGDGFSIVAAVLDSDQSAVASFVARSDVILVGATR